MISGCTARTRTFSWRRKIFLVSTPTIQGLSRIERPILEHHKTAMLRQGQWQASAVAQDPLTVGFHLSSLYSPVGWLSWQQIAQNWEAAKGSDEARRSFKNSILGQSWVEQGEAPDWQRLYDRREPYPRGVVPEGGLTLTAGADIQKDRIEVSIWAWGKGLESWLVDHVVIEAAPEQAASWEQLAQLMAQSWPHARGSSLVISKLGIDTGYQAPAVYAWARRQGFAQVVPVKGVDGFHRSAPVSGPTFVDATAQGRRLRRRVKLWTVAVATFKSETYRWLNLQRPTDEVRQGGCPAGYVHLPDSIDAEWVKQLAAEQLVTIKTRRGFTKLEWQKLRERNESLDCRVYARVATWIVGVDRFHPRIWQDLEDRLPPAPKRKSQLEDLGPATSAPHAPAPPSPPATRIKRPYGRVCRSRYMSGG